MHNILRSILFFPLTITNLYLEALSKIRPSLASYLTDDVYSKKSLEITAVSHDCDSKSVRIDLRVHTPNAMCRWRANSFSEKEPETLEWIEEFGGHGAFYDIGANVGLYSLYYAKLFAQRVYAFEPSVLNLGMLARNIDSNSLSSEIVIVPLPLTSVNQIALMQLTSSQEGGALSTFGAGYGHDGKELQTVMEYQMPGFTLDFLLSSRLIPQPPSLMKIDVDGIEHFILEGAKATLSLPHLRSVLVEVNDEFYQQANEVSLHLTEAGFSLRDKRQSSMFETGEYSSSYNQIWTRL